MKLFSEFAALMEDLRQPWYVANRPEPSAADQIFNIAKNAGVPNLHDKSKLHCTLIYSRSPCKQPHPRPDIRVPVHGEKWDVFHTRDGKNCLVLKLFAPMQAARHAGLMKDLEASYDFPQYLPHITVSYDVGDFDYSSLEVPGPFNMTGEYCELLDDLD